MDNAEVVAAEVCRILNSPYPVSLKPLHDIVCSFSPSTIKCWAIGNSCQINSLARVILEGLKTWPQGIAALLEAFAPVPRFRDSVLQHDPLFLHTALETACRGDVQTPRYVSICVSLLSSPLPESLTIPATFHKFLSYLVTEAANRPLSSSIRPLYLLINGVGADFFEVVPPESLLYLQEQIHRVLKQITEANVNLLCLATLARLSGRTTLTSGDCHILSQSEHPPSSNPIQSTDIFATARSFFVGKRAVKTLDLVILHAILSCRNDSIQASNQSLENLSLAKEIMDAMHHEQKQNWVESHGSTVQKFYDKLSRQSLPIPLQLRGLEVVISLVDVSSVPASLTAIMEDHLRRQWNLCEEIPYSIVTVLSTDFMTNLVSRYLNLLVSEDPATLATIEQLSHGLSLLKALRASASPELQEKLTLILSTNEIRESLKKLQWSPGGGFKRCSNCFSTWQTHTLSMRSMCGKYSHNTIAGAVSGFAEQIPESACPAYTFDLRIELMREACMLFLKPAIRTPSLDLADPLMDLLAALPSTKTRAQCELPIEELADAIAKVKELQLVVDVLRDTQAKMEKTTKEKELESLAISTAKDQFIEDLRKTNAAYATRVTSAVETALQRARGEMEGIEAEDVD